MVEDTTPEEVDRIRVERDLYQRLLELGREAELDPFLREALALVVGLTGARQGYLELFQDGQGPPRWWISHGFREEQIGEVRSNISNSIIAKALATGNTIVTPSAMLDPHLSQADSIVLKKIDAVLCAPIGQTPPIGVLYLQGRERPGLFDRAERRLAELFASHLAPLAGRLISEVESRREADPTAPYRRILDLGAVIGRSHALATVLKHISLAAPVDVGVLLTGDNGTGKSQLAEVIHANGPRSSRPFVEVNCGAIPTDLIESELFGCVEGAYTGARDRLGRVAAAEGGTLFLDEIAEIPHEAQSKLLQLLQKKTYHRLGSIEPQTANIRVIAASNADLPAAVRDKSFREDLFYRLNVLHIRVPPLAQRREDIPLLTRHFCTAASRRHGLPELEVSRGAELAAATSPWPGNIRQLEHACEVAVVRAAAEGTDTIEARHLFPDRTVPDAKALTFQEATRQFQAEFLRRALDENDWNVAKTAEQLDLARSYVYTLMHTLEVER